MKQRYFRQIFTATLSYLSFSTALLIISCQAPQTSPGQPTPLNANASTQNIPQAVTEKPFKSPKPSEIYPQAPEQSSAQTSLNNPSKQPVPETRVPQTVSTNPKTLIPISSIHAPADFDYATSRKVAVDIAVSNPNGKPYTKVMVAIYAPDETGLNPMVRGVTDQTGHYRDLIRVPYYLQSLDVQISGFGIANSNRVSIQNQQLQASFGPLGVK